MSSNTTTAFNDDAPENERIGALGELMANHRPSNSDVRAVMEFIRQDLEDQAFAKSARDNIVPFPPKNRDKDRGMASVDVDEFQILINGDFIEKPGTLNFEAMRAMVEATPVLSAVMMTRIRQVGQFCRVQESGSGPGFAIRHMDRDHQLSNTERESIQLLQRFFDNCGWEFAPRQRRLLKRDTFSQFMAKVVRDTLTMDACAIETEFKRDKAMGLDGFYAIDGSTIRLCSEDGYNKDDQIIALQVVQGRVRTAYTIDDIIYDPRNPRTDILAAGYGMGEVEMLVRTVTGYLNALTYNTKFFDSNSIPKGVLHLTGNYAEQDLAAFKRYWNSMVNGVNNAWTVPVLVSKDQESKAGFEHFGVEVNEMMFARWMTFLTSMICAVFGMDPAEINSDSFSAGTSPLSGSDTAERLAASKDKGLRPLLAYFENLFSDYIVRDFSDKYVFRFTGLDEQDEEKRHELRKLVLTVDEIRAQEGFDAHPDKTLGAAPVNPSLTGIYMQGLQAQEPEDFGEPPAGQPGADDNEDENDAQDDQGDQDGVPPADQDEPPADEPAEEQPPADDSADKGDMKKSLDFGLPPIRVGVDW